MTPIVCFASDFGLGDGWVGIVHARIVRAAPDVRVVDISHEIPPFDVRSGAVLTASAVPQLPGLVYLTVVDPGVGGPRRDIAIRARDGTILVGPDNGVLIPAARRAGGIARAVALDPRAVGHAHPAPTFHARDVLAPAAALLASGSELSSLGDESDPSGLHPGPFDPAREEGRYLVSEILDVDHFGSMRIGITREEARQDLEAGETLEISSGHTTLHIPFGATFCDVGEGEPIAMFDSSGWLSVAVNGGSAGERYGFEPGHPVRLLVARQRGDSRRGPRE